jgi:hypothetical protein
MSQTLSGATDLFSIRDLFGQAYRYRLFGALALLGVSYVVEHFANEYAFEYLERPTSASVGDFILDNTSTIDLNLIIIEGALFAIVFGILYTLRRPRYILFTLKAIALFITIRALFISLTHVGFYPDHIYPGLGLFDGLYLYLNFQLGFFFSGHAALPFLMALIFWANRRVRIIFLLMSLVFGVAVLLTHIHYSIDVFAAPFMAYSIFHIAKYLFPRDYELIESTSSSGT